MSKVFNTIQEMKHNILNHYIFALLTITLLTAVIIAAFWPVLSAQALSFDDDEYMVDNPLVHHPGWSSAGRFLSEVLHPSTVGGYYQPLNMISLMLDWRLGGRPDNLTPFHRTSLIIHVLNTLLIILLLYQLFGSFPAAALVGLLFGVHPMTVETIAWVSERKTLLAACFSLCSLVLYVNAARGKHKTLYYVGCFLTYILALMSKPTSLPLPVIFLLLDYWPLGRLSWRSVREKFPFFIAAGFCAAITIISQAATARVVAPRAFPLLQIPYTICHNVIFYLHKIFWPVNLSSHYPFPAPMSLSNPAILTGVVGTCVLLAALVISLRWTPAFLIGWLIFMVAALPTMQIFRFSDVIASDKFAYLPSVGLMLVLAWLLHRSWRTLRSRKSYVFRQSLIVIIILGLAAAESLATRHYLTFWKDSLTLYQRMIDLAPRSAIPHFALGCALRKQDRLDEAMQEFRLAVKFNPAYYPAYANLGLALAMTGHNDEAINALQTSLNLHPDDAAYFNLANAYVQAKQLDKAVPLYEQAIRLNPRYVAAYSNLAAAQTLLQQYDQALLNYQQALQLDPNHFNTRINFADTLLALGRYDLAIPQYEAALRLNPTSARAQEGLQTARLKISAKTSP